MEQVLSRRLMRDEDKPDLLIIDGGKGQLGVCTRVLKHLGMPDIPVVAMAKPKGAAKDRFFLPGRKDAIVPPSRSTALRLMQQIRDEAHRFAVKYHRHLRSNSLSSALTDIPGIGPKKAAAILRHTSHYIKDIEDLTAEDLKGCSGISEKDIALVIEYLASK